MPTQNIVSTGKVTVNNTNIAIVPNSIEYNEGLGEQSVKTASGGGKSVVLMISDNAEQLTSMVKFKLHSTEQNIELARSWKINTGKNAVTITNPGTEFTRTFLNATVVNNYPVGLGADKDFEVEFHSEQCV